MDNWSSGFRTTTLVTIGMICFALLFERRGMLPALAALVATSSLASDEFKIGEMLGNMVVPTILCIIVFKLGPGINISVIRGVWQRRPRTARFRGTAIGAGGFRRFRRFRQRAW